MIYLECQEPDNHGWASWRLDCTNATEVLLSSFESSGTVKITDLYKDDRAKRLMAAANGLFFGKCAYCESLIDSNQPGDVEHFRPKNRVTNENGDLVMGKNGEAHPGYYWLAYEFDNLLIACADCIRPSKKKTQGQLVGKWDRFPVRSFRAERPGEESDEEPLLINPRKDDPSDHLEVSADGIIIPKSEEGDACVSMFGLNLRLGLVKARRDAYRDAQTAFNLQAMARLNNGNSPSAEEKIAAIQAGSEPYSAAARAALRAAEVKALEDVRSVAGP